MVENHNKTTYRLQVSIKEEILSLLNWGERQESLMKGSDKITPELNLKSGFGMNSLQNQAWILFVSININ
jgi:hypothetical protein